MGKKNITLNNLSTAIEDLARMVKEGFDDVHGTMKAGFEKMNKHFDRIDAQLETIKRKCELINLHYERKKHHN